MINLYLDVRDFLTRMNLQNMVIEAYMSSFLIFNVKLLNAIWIYDEKGSFLA